MTILAYFLTSALSTIVVACLDFVNFSICTWFVSPKKNAGNFKAFLFDILSLVLAFGATIALLTLGKIVFCSLSNKDYGILAFSLSLLPIIVGAIKSHANILNGKTPSNIGLIYDQINKLDYLKENYADNPFYVRTSRILLGFHVFKNVGQIIAAISFYTNIIH